MGRQHRAVGQLGLVLGQQPLQAEQQRVVAPPLDGRLRAAGVELSESGIERHAAGGPGGQGYFRILAFQEEGFLGEALGARQVLAGNRRGCQNDGSAVGHLRLLV